MVPSTERLDTPAVWPRAMAAVLAAVLVAGLALAGCGGSAGGGATGPAAVPGPVSPEQLSQVTLRVGDQKGNSKTLLTAAGELKNVPYRIEWSTFTSGPPLLEAASAAAIDIGGVGNTPPVFAAAAKRDVAAVAAAKGNVTSDAALVPKGSPLRQLSDLRGKRIAVAKGSSAHGVLLNALGRAGLTSKDVQIAFLQPSEAYSAFRGGDVDAWFIWDPYTSQALQETGARVLAGGQGLTNGYSFQVASRSALADPGRNAALRDYVLRLARAQAWAQRHPEQLATTWAADTGLAKEVTLAAVRQGVDLDFPLDERVVTSEQQLADQFADAGIVPGRARFADYVDTRYQADLARARNAP